MSVVEDLSRRRGGREARRAIRGRPIAMEDAAVKPGMMGGHYKPLADADMARIHRSALELLETVGMAKPIASCQEAMEARGCFMQGERLCIPHGLVEDILSQLRPPIRAPRPRSPLRHEPWGNRAYFGTAGAAVHIVEPETRSYRESLLVDLYDAARIVDTCEHIHFFQRTVVPRDMVSGHDMDINTLYACLAGTQKHVGTSMVAGRARHRVP